VLSLKDTLKGRLPKIKYFFPGHSTLALILCPEDCNTFLGNLPKYGMYVYMYIYIYIYRERERERDNMYLPNLKELTDTLLYVQQTKVKIDIKVERCKSLL
jgi:hypothetical protein